MILGLGTDLLEIHRMQAELARPDRGFRDSVFTAAEIAYCESKAAPAEHYAARFAAKEALLKALGNAGPAGYYWRDIEVRNQPDGKPCLFLHDRMLDIAHQAGVTSMILSLSHTRTMAAATVLLQS
jgi:holo-[acyl-carrier protein] synthase